MNDRQDTALRGLQEGQALLEMGRTTDAVGVLSAAIASDPQNPVGHTMLAAAMLRLERFAEAAAAARRALALDPDNDAAHRVLALALLRQGDNREAHTEALRAVDLAPESHHGYIVLSEALLAVGDLAGALEAAEHAVRLAPESSGAHSAVALVKLRHDDAPAAEAAAREALRLDPHNPTALNNLGVALRRQRRTREAVQAYEQAVRVSPQHRTIRSNVLGLRHSRARKHLGEPTRALIADDTRARRYQPQRWDYSRAKRLRPWWWLAFKRIPAPQALAANAALFLIVLLLTLGSRHQTWGWVVVLGLALPFSARRAWFWWRIQHPAANSWTPDTGKHPRPEQTD